MNGHSIDSSPPATPPVPTQGTAEHVSATGSLLGDPLHSTDPAFASDRDAPLPQIAGYEIAGVLGVGGMGVVYRARQVAANRPVAIKMILSGDHASSADVARFRAEAEAVAGLQHPNVVAVYEVGSHAGRPFFSMEFCPGGSLAARLKGDPLPPRAAAELVVALAQGVAAAHAAGIIHRDVKPQNVLLAADGTPKVSDFGLAKRTDTDGGMTATGAVLGTPSYMPPEQAFGEAKRVGPPADVYSLGAILYHLLAGRPPFQGTTTADTLHLVRTQEPVSPRSLVGPAVPRDLETVCLKCLQKEPAKRYATAGDLADDLARWLDGRPVAARPVGRAERAWRLCRRHPGTAVATAAAVALLVAGTVVSSVFAVRAGRDRQTAEAAKVRAEDERDTARAISDFFRKEVLGQASVFNQPGANDPGLTVRTALDRAAAKIDGSFVGRPAVEAAVRLTVGNAYRDLDLFDAAEPHLTAALRLRETHLGPDHADTLDAVAALGRQREGQGRYADAEGLHRRAADGAAGGANAFDAAVYLGSLGGFHIVQARYADALAASERAYAEFVRLGRADDPGAMSARSNVGQAYFLLGRYADAEPVLTDVLAARTRVLGPDHPNTLASENDLASLWTTLGRAAEAEPMRQRVLAAQRRLLGDDHRHTVTSLYNLAMVHRDLARYDAAEKELTEVVERRTRQPGPDHPITLSAVVTLGQLYKTRGRLDRAEAVLTDALTRSRRALGEGHPDTHGTAATLAAVVHGRGRTAEARPMLEAAYDGLRAAYGDDHPTALSAAVSLGNLYRDVRELSRAEPIFERIVATCRRTYGPDHAKTLIALNNLGSVYYDRGQFARQEAVLADIAERGKRTLGEAHPDRLIWVVNLATAMQRQGRAAEAEPQLVAAAALFAKAHGDDHPRTLDIQRILAELQIDRGKRAEAAALLRSVADRQRAAVGADAPQRMNTLATLGLLLNTDGKYADAEAPLRECLAVRERTMPDDWRRFFTAAMLGEALLGQGKAAEAVPLLRAGADAVRAQQAKVPASTLARIGPMADRLARLADAVADPAARASCQGEAAKFAELARPPEPKP